MTIAGTGHRPNKLGYEYDLKGPITKLIEENITLFINKYKPNDIISGMALGFDQILAIVAIKHKIRLRAAIPFEGQELAWPVSSQQLYKKILTHVAEKDKIPLFGKGYAPWKMQKRNEWMVDQLVNSDDLLLGCYDGTHGGTQNCIMYALDKQINPFIIDPHKGTLKRFKPC